jgi:hypothetical protein
MEWFDMLVTSMWFLSVAVCGTRLCHEVCYLYMLSLPRSFLLSVSFVMGRIYQVTECVRKYIETNVLVLGSGMVPDIVSTQRVLERDPMSTPICEKNVYGLDTRTGWVIKSKSSQACRRLFIE